MTEFDLRGKTVAETGRALIDRYNACAAGARFAARVDDYPASLRVWLLEAGVRHSADPVADGGQRLEIERRSVPAQGSIPGVHHVVAGGGSVWTCERAWRVARIDCGEQRIAATATVARAASHLVHDAGADRLFIADAGGNEVIALCASDLGFEQSWPAPGRPQLPLVSPEGIVCVTGGRESGTLTIARPRAGRYVEQTIAVGHCPHDPLLDADGAHVFVPCAGSGELVKVRLADGTVAGRCAAGDGPSHLALHPDGTRVYAANSWDGTVICVTTEGERMAGAASGGWAHAIEITPDGRWVYVANFLDDTLTVFAADTLERAACLPTEPYPHGLDISPDGRYAIATGFASSQLRLYDAQAHTEIARIEVGRGSSHSTFSADSTHAFVGCSVDDHVACVDLAARRCVTRMRLDGLIPPTEGEIRI